MSLTSNILIVLLLIIYRRISYKNILPTNLPTIHLTLQILSVHLNWSFIIYRRIGYKHLTLQILSVHLNWSPADLLNFSFFFFWLVVVILLLTTPFLSIWVVWWSFASNDTRKIRVLLNVTWSLKLSLNLR